MSGPRRGLIQARHLPNLLTGLRLLLAPLLPWLLVSGRAGAALAVAALAGLSDALDGWLAKRFGWGSRLGSLLDPIADKLMLGLAMLGLWLVAALPGWLLLLVALRDLVIVAGAVAWWRLAGPYDGRPTWLGKLTTFAQVLLVLACLLGLVGWLPWAPYAGQAVLVVAMLTFASGLDYVIRYGVMAWRHSRKPAA
ncbi:CDP-alcohol phosphatidyltransferase family protein [Arenimonas fontis]|uniref:CDP-diacylglycerol--glycerol-3-phosphate 3-phosphatidyltransferase n=1 Tax=Arenimonas fontis TaxID=2608255 RepID=A0A5B2ZAS3_9GAMM|nr:CDP-alcohol phosphatidyltransferase family protein [Arenimonas fontis]KAA2285206.1 CDP-alcohol phosphatidyltransferase family protein [Arenimonas fontis]